MEPPVRNFNGPATGAPLVAAGRSPSMFNPADWWRFNNQNNLLPRAPWAEALDPYAEAIFGAGTPQPGSPSTIPGYQPPVIGPYPLSGMPGTEHANQPDPSMAGIDTPTLATQAAMGNEAAGKVVLDRNAQGNPFPMAEPTPQLPQSPPPALDPADIGAWLRAGQAYTAPGSAAVPPSAVNGAPAPSGGSGGGYDFQGLPAPPKLPGLTGAINIPDLIGLDPYPTAPTMVNPDYSKADAYLQASKPGDQALTSDTDVAMMLLAGMAQGYGDGSGNVGQLLGRMAGPGLAAAVQGKATQRAELRDQDRLLAEWNRAMGQTEGSRAETTASTTNTNASNQYNNRLGKREEDLGLYKWSDERQRADAQQRLELWKAAAQVAQENNTNAYRSRMADIAENRNLLYAATRGQPTMAALTTGIQNVVKMGILPGSGIDLNARKDEIRRALQASDPMLMANPQALENRVNQQLYQEVYVNAVQDKQILSNILSMSSRGHGMELLDALAGGE